MPKNRIQLVLPIQMKLSQLCKPQFVQKIPRLLFFWKDLPNTDIRLSPSNSSCHSIQLQDSQKGENNTPKTSENRKVKWPKVENTSKTKTVALSSQEKQVNAEKVSLICTTKYKLRFYSRGYHQLSITYPRGNSNRLQLVKTLTTCTGYLLFILDEIKVDVWSNTEQTINNCPYQTRIESE